VFRDQHVVFDSHATPAREIGAGLDCEDHPGCDGLVYFVNKEKTGGLHRLAEDAAWFEARRLQAHVSVTDETDYAASFVVVEYKDPEP